MQRIIGMTIAAFAFSSLGGVPATARAGGPMAMAGYEQGNLDQGRSRGAMIDVTALLAAARGAPPMICSLASRSLQGWGWGGSDAPATPLSMVAANVGDDDDSPVQALPAADLQKLFTGLASDDACVRELSVRLIGRQKPEFVDRDLMVHLDNRYLSLALPENPYF